MDFHDPALAASVYDYEAEMKAQAAEQDNTDYEDGYGFALDWQPGMPVPPLGNRAFEGGVSAGMERNDPTTRAAWEQANRNR